MTSVLGYDSLNAISLNWYVFVGILIGSATVFYRQVVLRKGFKFLIYVGFLLILVYQYYMYFLIDPDLNIESFYLPNLLKGIGHGILYICLTIYIAKSVPFKHFFQGLCVLSFIRTSVATPLGTAILNRSLKYMQQDNIGLLSRNIDRVSPVRVRRGDFMISMPKLSSDHADQFERVFWSCLHSGISFFAGCFSVSPHPFPLALLPASPAQADEPYFRELFL